MNLFMKFMMKVNIRYRRYVNNKCRYDYPPEQGGWSKQGQLDIKGIDGSIFDPYVLIQDRIKLYYSNRKTKSIDLVESEDGRLWTVSIPVLEGNDDDKWDSTVNRACVIYHDDRYMMWYTGQYQGRSCIGCAHSIDGKKYRRICQEPVLIPEMPYEKSSVMNPCVLWNEDLQVYQMWYASGETYEPDNICYAVSDDGICWIKSIENNPVLSRSINLYDQYKVGGCDVHYVNGKYIMYYIGYQNVDVARICVALSEDGISWERSEMNPIISPSKSGWDQDAVYKPCVAKYKGITYLWYNGRKKNRERIGYAVKRDSMV